MQKPRESVRLFENDLLEKLSHVHPITPLVLWTPVVGYLTYRAVAVNSISPSILALLSASGLLFWTFFEYCLHRFVFHWNTQNKYAKHFVFIMHGVHHETPQDPSRLVMPPAPGILLATLLYFLFRSMLGPIYVDSFFSAFMVGYLVYDYTHFCVHHFGPRTPIGKFLKQYHMYHHYVDPEARYGVSSPLWDFIFGSAAIQHNGKKRANRETPVRPAV